MPHPILDHRVDLLEDHTKLAANILASVLQVQRQRVQIQIRPAQAHIVVKVKSDTRRHQHLTITATGNRICEAMEMEIAVNVDIEMIGMDVDHAKIRIRDRKPMEEVWNWHQATQVMKKNHAPDRAESHQHRMVMSAYRVLRHTCQTSPNTFR